MQTSAERGRAGAASSVVVKLPELSQLALNRGLSLMSLADHADLAKGTLGRIFAGKPVRRSTAARLYATLIDIPELSGLDTLSLPARWHEPKEQTL